MKNILISGATGIVGKRLLQHLQKTSIENKYKLRIISRKLQSGYETILCDLEKERIPHAAITNSQPIACQDLPAASIGAINGLLAVLLPRTISATNTGKQTTRTIST